MSLSIGTFLVAQLVEENAMRYSKVCNGASAKHIFKNIEEAENVSPIDMFATKQLIPVVCVFFQCPKAFKRNTMLMIAA
jgi:hypothetical protein